MKDITNSPTTPPGVASTDAEVPRKIGFLLIDNFTLIAQAAAIEPLRMANHLAGRALYEWFTISLDGQPVRASDGLCIMPDASLSDAPAADIIILCSGIAPLSSVRPGHLNYLQQQARKGTQLGAVCTGSLLLAKAGLLDNRKASVHWECIASLQETHPHVLVTTRLYTIDGDRLTASGGTAPMDMMLHLIGQQHGRELMAAISEMFVCDRMRGDQEQQRVPLRHVVGTSQPKLLDIVALMEANIEEPLELEELARYIGVSRRQIERLFVRHLNMSPSRYYLSIRLERARQLLRQTSMRIIEVGIACGFVSTPHFSKCYREYFGVPPREERASSGAQAAHQPGACESMAVTTGLLAPANDDGAAQRSLARDALQTARAEPSYGSMSRTGRPARGVTAALANG